MKISVCRGVASFPLTNDGVYCTGEARRRAFGSRLLAIALDREALGDQKGSICGSRRLVYLSLGVRLAMDLPKCMGLSPPELSVLDDTKRSDDVNHFLARLAESALTARFCVVRPRCVGEIGKGSEGVPGEDWWCLRSAMRGRFRTESRRGCSALVDDPLSKYEDGDECEGDDNGDWDDCIVLWIDLSLLGSIRRLVSGVE